MPRAMTKRPKTKKVKGPEDQMPDVAAEDFRSCHRSRRAAFQRTAAPNHAVEPVEEPRETRPPGAVPSSAIISPRR